LVYNFFFFFFKKKKNELPRVRPITKTKNTLNNIENNETCIIPYVNKFQSLNEAKVLKNKNKHE